MKDITALKQVLYVMLIFLSRANPLFAWGSGYGQAVPLDELIKDSPFIAIIDVHSLTVENIGEGAFDRKPLIIWRAKGNPVRMMKGRLPDSFDIFSWNSTKSPMLRKGRFLAFLCFVDAAKYNSPKNVWPNITASHYFPTSWMSLCPITKDGRVSWYELLSDDRSERRWWPLQTLIGRIQSYLPAE